MYSVNWSYFDIKNPDAERAFQRMCQHLFMRKGLF